jgi:alpha-L-fucosidase
MMKNDEKKPKKSKTVFWKNLIYLSNILFFFNFSFSHTIAENMEEFKIVLMGNSITQSWKEFNPTFFSKNSFLVNKGVSGQTTVEMLERFQKDVISQNPRAVFILAGINDIAQNSGYISIDDIAKNIINMGLMAKEKNIDVIICSTLPVTEIKWNDKINEPNKKVLDLNKKLKKAVKKHNFIYLDYYAKMVNDLENLTYDGLHPNLKGYIKMESIIRTTLDKIISNDN